MGGKKKDKGGQKKQSFCSKTNGPVDLDDDEIDIRQVLEEFTESVEFEEDPGVPKSEDTTVVFKEHGGSDENEAKSSKLNKLEDQIFEVLKNRSRYGEIGSIDSFLGSNKHGRQWEDCKTCLCP